MEFNFKNNKKTRDHINKELAFCKTTDEKVKYLNDMIVELSELKDNYENKKERIKLSDLIEGLNYKIHRIGKRGNTTRKVKVKKKSKVQKTKKSETDFIFSQMLLGKVAVSNEPIIYINAIKEYLNLIDISNNYSNIMYYITELEQNFVKDNYSPIIQKYYIKYLIDVFKKARTKYPKDDPSRNIIKKIVNHLENIEYRKINVTDVQIKYINPDILETITKKHISSRKAQKQLDIDDNNEFVFIILDFLDNKVNNLSDDNISNKYIFNITEYLVSSIPDIDSEYYEAFKLKLLEIRKKVKPKVNFKRKNYPKTVYGRLYTELSQIIDKIDNYQFKNMIYKDDISIHRTVKYIINDLGSIELLDAIMDKIPDCIDEKTFNETLETYFNIILNSNDFGLITYYQKVIEKIFSSSNISKSQMLSRVNSQINSIIESPKFKSREDCLRRINLLKHTVIILNKISGHYYNEMLENYIMNDTKEETSTHIFTLDPTGVKVFENAFSVDIMEDDYVLTLYTSDISKYLKANNFKETLRSFLNQKCVNLRKSSYDYSLAKGKPRDAIAFRFVIDKNAKVKDFNVYQTNITVFKNLRYSNALEVANESDVTLSNELLYLCQICSLIDNTNTSELEKQENKILAIINSKITHFCNSYINNYFAKKGLPLIDRESINSYYKYVDEYRVDDKQIPNYHELLDNLYKKYRKGILYNSSNYNLITPKYSKVSSPMREVDSLVNQLLAHYYFNNEVNLGEANMINFILDCICDELNKPANKQKKLTKKNKVVKLNQGNDKDMII